MSSPLCANCSRDSSRTGLGIGFVVQVEKEKQVGTGVEVICSQFGIRGPVEEVGSVPVVVGPVVKVRGPVVALIGVEAMEVLSLVVQAVTVNVVEALGAVYEVANPLAHESPWSKKGSVDEVRSSVVKLVFFAIQSVASVIHVCSGGLAGLASEVIGSAVESIGPVVKVGPNVMDPELVATDSVLEV